MWQNQQPSPCQLLVPYHVSGHSLGPPRPKQEHGYPGAFLGISEREGTSLRMQMPNCVCWCGLVKTSHVYGHSGDSQLQLVVRKKASRSMGCSHETSKSHKLGVTVLSSPFNIQDQSCPPIPGPTEKPSRICIHTPERKRKNSM